MSEKKRGLYTHEAWYKIVEVTSTSTSKETFVSAQGLSASEVMGMLKETKETMEK